MATAHAPHALILASRVTGTPIFDQAGERIGHVHDLSIDKLSGQCIYALLSFGGVLGIGEHYQTVPWAALTYDTDRSGFTLAMPKADIKDAAALSQADLEELGAGHRSEPTPFI